MQGIIAGNVVVCGVNPDRFFAGHEFGPPFKPTGATHGNETTWCNLLLMATVADGSSALRNRSFRE
jgi:hypothetical protein